MSAVSTRCTRPSVRWLSGATRCSRPPSRRCVGSACAPGGSARSPPPPWFCSTTSTAAPHDQQAREAATGNGSLDPKRRRAGRPFTGRVRVDRPNWLVFLPGLLPFYISVGQYERNLERMNANRARAESLGAVRDGPALLAGLVVCGRCGARMTVHYQRGPAGRRQPVYACDRAKVDYAATSCQQLAGACLDAHVAELLLAAIAPAALEVSLAAAEQVEAGRTEVDRIWRARLERAEFAADRARRQYQLAEPENRLVVRQLERDWEAALAERQRLGEEY